VDLDRYRAEAEAFLAELHGAYYRHYAGLEEDFPLEAIYAAHADLFGDAAVDGLAGAGAPALRAFAVEGHLERAVAGLEAERARREATLRVEAGGRPLGFREAALAQAAEPDRDRRQDIEQARLAVVAEALNPLAREALETVHARSRELGWASQRAMWAELKGLDLDALLEQARAFLAATEAAFPALLEPELRETVGVGAGEWRRSDLPRLLRAAGHDDAFPAAGLVDALRATAAGLGLGLDARPNVALDVERRPNKSPRAFCAPVRVPADVRLVLPPVGGAEDYEILFHEGGHALHFGSVDPALPFEQRCLGDSAVTEAFAFLLEHVTGDPTWLGERLGLADPGPYVAHRRARRLLYLRRYCAKIAYEAELHAAPTLDGLDARYAQRLSDALGLEWPAAMWLTDLDPGFYAADYLRAWALEATLRAGLRAAHGPAWWREPAAGAELLGLMRAGQPHRAEEVLGAPDLAALVADLGVA
jgi:hypothetical protein